MSVGSEPSLHIWHIGFEPVFIISGIFDGGGAGTGGRFEPSQHLDARWRSSAQLALGFENTARAWEAHVRFTDSRYPSGNFIPPFPLSPHMWHLFVIPANTYGMKKIIGNIFYGFIYHGSLSGLNRNSYTYN
jgi:hypothetical protein